MKRQTPLFDLIHSLDKTEKRYFKLFAKTHRNGSNYLKLFEIIQRQKEYDEESIRTAFRDKKMLRQISVSKNHLFKMILKAMEQYHRSDRLEKMQADELQGIRFLMTKNLLNYVSKSLESIWERANQSENLLLQLDIIRLRRQLAAQQNYQYTDEETIKGWIQESKRIMHDMEIEFEYDLLSAQVFERFFKYGKSRNIDEYKYIRNILENPLFAVNAKPPTFKSKYLYYNTLAFFYGQQDEYQKSYEQLQKAAILMREKKHMRSEVLINFISVLNNTFICQCELGLHEQAGKTLTELEQLPGKYQLAMNRLAERMWFMNLYASKCFYMIDSGDVNQCVRLLPELEKGLKKYQLPVWYKLYFSYHIAYIYYFNGDLEHALDHSNLIINEFEDQSGQDIYAFARMLNLFIHYELGHTTLLPYIVKSTYRFLKKKKRLYGVEKELLKLIRRLPSIPDKNTLNKVFKEIKTTLEVLTDQDVFERQSLLYFDFLSWLNAKINGEIFKPSGRLKKSI